MCCWKRKAGIGMKRGGGVGGGALGGGGGGGGKRREGRKGGKGEKTYLIVGHGLVGKPRARGGKLGWKGISRKVGR